MMMLIDGTIGKTIGPAMMEEAHLGDFVLSPQAAVADLGRAYGLVLEPSQAGLSLAGLLRRELGATATVGERLPLGPIELVVRAIDEHGAVRCVGLALEPLDTWAP
jgi:cell volume regulation protein A